MQLCILKPIVHFMDIYMHANTACNNVIIKIKIMFTYFIVTFVIIV